MEQLDYPAPESSIDFATMMGPLHPEDRGRVEQAIQAYLAGQTEEFRLEYRVQHSDGSYRWFVSRGMAVRDAEGKPIRFVGTRVDITDLKRIEEAAAPCQRPPGLGVSRLEHHHCRIEHIRWRSREWSMGLG